MASSQTGHRPGSQRLDGRPHPVKDVLAVFTVLAGVVSFLLGMVVRDTPGEGAAMVIVATATGLAAFLVGICTQMVSASRVQRILLVSGMIGGFVGLALGLAHGGFAA